MTRKITIMALIAGIVLGAAVTEGLNVYRQSQESYRQSRDSMIFQQRARCKAAADAYVKENTDLKDNGVTGTSVTLDKVNYSPARNSCIAEVETTNFFKGGALNYYSVRDLLSGEALFTVSCNRGCIDIALQKRWLDPAFDYVMDNADEPVALEKAYAQIESQLTPKATAPPSSVAEPNDWQTIKVPEYDAHGKPLVSPQSPSTGKEDFYPDTAKPIQTHGPSQK